MLEAREPTLAEVEVEAVRLSGWYNEAHNRAMMTNQQEMAAADVVEHFESVRQRGGRAFLLYAQDGLMGDADLRHVDPARGTAEVAVLIGDRRRQGQGLGTCFGLMLHALAFGRLGMERVYASIIPANAGSLRLFEKLGYAVDTSSAARFYAEAADDVTLSLGRAEFLHRHGDAVGEMRMLAIG